MEVAHAIRMKRAVREFRQEPLPEEIVGDILNAGRRAQSAKNRQLWRFIVVRERERLVALSKLGTFAGHLAGAALGVVLLTPDPAERWSMMFDAGQAAAYMQLAAWAHGVGSCPATIYQPEAARSLLGFPEDWHTRVALSFGYPADPEALTARPRAGGRETLDALVHDETW